MSDKSDIQIAIYASVAAVILNMIIQFAIIIIHFRELSHKIDDCCCSVEEKE